MIHSLNFVHVVLQEQDFSTAGNVKNLARFGRTRFGCWS